MKYLVLGLLLLPAPIVSAAERAIELSVAVRAPVAEVWRAWTTTEGVTSFFAPEARVELRVDGPFELYMDPLAEPGAKGADGMRILAFQERKMLSFTWNAPPSLPEARKQRTHVVVRFEGVGDTVTTVTLHHDGWGTGGEWDAAFSYFSQAWPKVLANLQKRFHSGPIDWSVWLEQMRTMHKTK